MTTLDGVDHVNIYLKGKTSLGRSLSNLADLSVTLPDAGKFRTLEGYWYWLSWPNDQFRSLDGFSCKKLGQQLKKSANKGFTHSDFKDKIKLAIWLKLEQYPEVLNEFVRSTLPLTHYYDYNGKIIQLPQFHWIVQIFKEFRYILKQRYGFTP